jgi:hypothetical protein
LTFCGGLDPTKTILTPSRIRKRMGEIKRTVLILRRGFLSLDYLKIIIEEKLLLHNAQVF